MVGIDVASFYVSDGGAALWPCSPLYPDRAGRDVKAIERGKLWEKTI
jgi:hypothetical protein